jgi:hypothetical protein
MLQGYQAMKCVVALAIALALTAPIAAQPVEPSLADDLNEAIQANQPAETAEDERLSGMIGGKVVKSIALPGQGLSAPEWGVIVKDLKNGSVIDAFGQVRYEITANGQVTVPGFEPPEGTYLELVPTQEWQSVAAALTTTDQLDPTVAPLTGLPSIVQKATDYLAEQMCLTKSRPSSITLVLMVGASGNILFAEASTDAGSEVTWDLAGDVCPRYYPAATD